MAEFTMPSLGADMDHGTLLEWLVRPGDVIHRGDPIAVVDTSKAAIEVESFVTGVVDELLAPVGTTVAVGTPLARITTADEPAPSAPAPSAPAPSAPAPSAPAPAAPAPAAPAPAVVERASVRATPLARRLAAELGVAIETLGTAGGLPVRAEAVRAAAAATSDAARAPAPAAPATEPPATEPQTEPPQAVVPPTAAREGMRAAIAALMTRANREIPHYYLGASVDLGRTMQWLEQHNRDVPVAERIVPAALLLKATALAAAECPGLNGFWTADGFEPGTGVHLGVAISLRTGGLVAPALHDADQLPVAELMRQLVDLVTRARAGRLRRRELSDPTLTVTNLGDQGAETVYGVLYPPQVALVGFGRVTQRPVAVDGMLAVRPTTALTLAADHRATDGFAGSRLLARVDHHLQHPEAL